MRSRILAFLMGISLCAAGSSQSLPEAAGEFTSFDAPQASYGTFVVGVLPDGKILGYTLDVGLLLHGFVRERDGQITMIDAGLPAPSSLSQELGTMPASMNRQGAITGYFSDAEGIYHGFVREPGGEVSLFDAPNRDGFEVKSTFATNIAEDGAIAGYAFDTNFIAHGFIRDRDGSYQYFSVPEIPVTTIIFSASSVFPASFYGKSPSGDLIGYEQDKSWSFHGWLRDAKGQITVFDDPDTIEGVKLGTMPGAINAQGAIVGNFKDATGQIHGFLRSRNGEYTTIDPPGASVTVPSSISPAGIVVGYFSYPNGNLRGFLREPDGELEIIDAPGGEANIYTAPFTLPFGIDSEGAVAGYYQATDGVYHGFVWHPDKAR